MKNSPHPGELTHAEIIEALELNVSPAAQILKVHRATLSDWLNGKEALSADMALHLEKVFGVDIDQLPRMQVAHDEAQTRRHKDIDVKRYAPT